MHPKQVAVLHVHCTHYNTAEEQTLLLHPTQRCISAKESQTAAGADISRKSQPQKTKPACCLQNDVRKTAAAFFMMCSAGDCCHCRAPKGHTLCTYAAAAGESKCSCSMGLPVLV